ncbi:hypothetical protein BSK66_26725 [Paenibacillus odorifer]|uniref:hypothetical protein n=1 Tax=Paenibacillus TaxID=44249 RepID=UPI0003E27B38|nr:MULTISPECIES: hypothetical protein [Paenibacillus]ETT49343.1 hypothetical protein C171_23760 [Paenibacillus sp. FSL H8-237]OME49555.1 hypothetical protein BSK66_26725 [Paenibacillus odorifer]
MATRILDALKTKGTHEVGNLSSWKVKTVASGAIVSATPIDNFLLVELGFNVEGERTCEVLSDVTKKSYLIAAQERRFLNEELVDFYNAVGERARIVVLEPGYTRFDTSAFTLNAGVTEVKNGQVAHFDPTTKKYILSTVSSPHADYATAKAKFLVVGDEDDLEYTVGKALVKLEVQEA